MADLTLPDPPLSDGAVTLRGFESGDSARLVEMCQDPAIPRWTLVPADGTRASCAVTDAGDGSMLGTAGIMAIDYAVAARTGFIQVGEPVVQRGETAHFTADIFFARTRGG